MPVAVVQEWRDEETDRSTANAIAERLAIDENPPDGLLLQTRDRLDRAFGLRRVAVGGRLSRRFTEKRLMPLVAEVVGDDAEPPERSVYELHGVYTPRWLMPRR